MSGRHIQNQTLQDKPSRGLGLYSVDEEEDERTRYDDLEVKYFRKKRSYRTVLKVFRGWQD